MTTQPPNNDSIVKFQKQKSILGQIPVLSKAGFSQVADHMGNFSVGFASGVTQAFAIRERLSVNKTDLGIKPLRNDYRRINQEINTVFQDISELIDDQIHIKEYLHKITVWALNLEQDAYLPTLTDQIRGQVSNALEQQTLGSIVDSLMRQIRTLIREIVLSTQESANLLNSLSRRLSADLETSKHNFSTLKSRSTSLMKQMTEMVEAMDLCCEGMEGNTNQVNSVIFEMVQSMQYDDITSQRIEHMVTTLERVEEYLSRPRLTNKDKRWVAIASSIVLEHAESASKNLFTAVESLHGHLQQISHLATERRDSVALARDNGMAFQQNILDLSYHLGALLRLSIFDDDFSTELLRTFSKMENTVFQTKRAFDMLLLTAQRLDQLLSTLECKGNRRLTTLVDTIRTLMEEVRTEGVVQSKELLNITRKLQDISSDYSEHSTPKIMRVTTLLRRAPLRAQQMDSDHTDVLNLFNDTLGETQAIIIQIKLLMADMNFHQHIEKNAQRVFQNITELLPQIVGSEIVTLVQSPEENLSSLAEEFEDLSNLYTMASERETHGNVLGVSNSGEEDEEDDGIELF